MWFVAEADYDLDALGRRADVVMNLISDADRGAEVLPSAAGLVDRLTRPVVNHPGLVARTDRACRGRPNSASPQACTLDRKFFSA